MNIEISQLVFDSKVVYDTCSRRGGERRGGEGERGGREREREGGREKREKGGLVALLVCQHVVSRAALL